MKSNRKNEFMYYGNVISKLDIITIGLCIVKYEQRQITYRELKKALKSKNIELKPYLHDIPTKKMTKQQYQELKNKFANEEYDPEYLKGYIISGKYYKDVLVRYDRTMINVLSEYGDEYSKKVLDGILEWEKRFVGSKRMK